jgi:hypothetical protein
VSQRSALIFALLLSSLTASIARDARAQAEPMTVTILRRTAVRTAPSSIANTIANVNPSTFEVTQFQVKSGFVRLLLSQIDRRRPTSGYGFIDTVDVAIDSGTKVTVSARPDTVVRARTVTAVPDRPATVAAVRPDPVVPSRPVAVVPARKDTTTATTTVTPTETVLRTTTPKTAELIVRPDAPPPPPSTVDSPDLSFLKQGPLAAILQRPMSYQIGKSRDSITVPAGFVTEFASIPRSLWSALSPVGEHERAAIVHDYLYWFQPCEREETDNLLMIAMREAGVSDLQRGAVYAGVRVGSADAWNASAVARDRGDLKVVPTQVRPTAQESWSDFRARLGKADIRGTPGRMPRQKFCDYGKSQQVP